MLCSVVVRMHTNKTSCNAGLCCVFSSSDSKTQHMHCATLFKITNSNFINYNLMSNFISKIKIPHTFAQMDNQKGRRARQM